MKGLPAGLLAGFAISALWAMPVAAQEKDRSLERISVALKESTPIVFDAPAVSGDFPKKLGPFTLVQPVQRGEMIRLQIPIGEYVSRAINGIAKAHERRKVAGIRRQIEAELELLKAQQKK